MSSAKNTSSFTKINLPLLIEEPTDVADYFPPEIAKAIWGPEFEKEQAQKETK